MDFLTVQWFASKPTYNLIQEDPPEDISFIEYSLLDLFDIDSRKSIMGGLTDSQKRKVNGSLKWLYKNKGIHNLIVTMDWLPCLRYVVKKANEVGYRTFLVPHEGIMQDESLYYMYPRGKSGDIPACDVSLVWGSQQERIFKRRGYKGKLVKVGSPKLDNHVGYEPTISRSNLLDTYGFEDVPTILFVCQYFDTQFGSRGKALRAQMEAIKDVKNVCDKKGMNLVVRCPPGNPSSIFSSNKSFVGNMVDDNLSFEGYDKGSVANYKVSAEDSIHLSDMTLSFNSTMVLEAAIAEKPVGIMDYFDYYKMWHEKADAPLVSPDTVTGIDEIIEEDKVFNIDWASREYGIGEFDGKSLERIYSILQRGANQ